NLPLPLFFKEGRSGSVAATQPIQCNVHDVTVFEPQIEIVSRETPLISTIVLPVPVRVGTFSRPGTRACRVLASVPDPRREAPCSLPPNIRKLDPYSYRGRHGSLALCRPEPSGSSPLALARPSTFRRAVSPPEPTVSRCPAPPPSDRRPCVRSWHRTTRFDRTPCRRRLCS